jgi:hypothetical protein
MEEQTFSFGVKALFERMVTHTESMDKDIRIHEQQQQSAGFVSSWISFVRSIVVNIMETATSVLHLPAKVWHILPVPHLSIPFGLSGSGGHVGRKELQEIANVQEKKRRESESEQEQEAKLILVEQEENKVTTALKEEVQNEQEKKEDDTGGLHLVVPAFTSSIEEELQKQPQDEEVEFKYVDTSSILHAMTEKNIILAKSPTSTNTEVSDAQEDSDIDLVLDTKKVAFVRKNLHEELHELTMSGSKQSTENTEEKKRDLKEKTQVKEYTDLNISEALSFMPVVASAIFS